MHIQFRSALQQTHPEDLLTIRHYVRWVAFRRRIHDAFYQPPVHWIQPAKKAHWL